MATCAAAQVTDPSWMQHTLSALPRDAEKLVRMAAVDAVWKRTAMEVDAARTTQAKMKDL